MAEFITSQRGRTMLLLNGFLFIQEKKRSTRVYWRCQKKHCKSRAITCGEVVTSVTYEHNHENDPVDIEVRQLLEKVKNDAITTTDDPREIFQNAAACISEGAATILPSTRSIIRTIQRARHRQNSSLAFNGDDELTADSFFNKVPDLNERLGIEGSSVPTKEGSSSNFLTCSPLLSSMPGIHEDALSLGAGPSSSIQSTNDNDADYQDEIDVKAEPVFNVEPEICEEENSQSNTQLSTDRRSHQSSPTPSMIGPYLLKKETHCTTILDQLLRDDTFSDVTLTAEGQSIRAHKIVLCLASAYFRQVLSKESNVQNVIVFRDVKFMELKNLINFIYTGEATVDAADLESFMKTAEMLEVTSLCDGQRNFPKNLFPKSKEVESEKAPSSSPSKTHFSSAKRSLASSSAVSNGSPPRKTRKTDSKDKKSSAALSLPSTSGGGTLRSNNCITEPISTIIKTEPVLEDSNVDEDYELKIGTDVSFESLTRSLPPLHSSRVSTDLVENQSPTSDSLNNETATLEKVPVGKCPFCPSSQPIRKGSELSKHMYTHHQEKAVFCCENCSRVFLKKGSFEAHKDDCQ